MPASSVDMICGRPSSAERFRRWQ